MLAYESKLNWNIPLPTSYFRSAFDGSFWSSKNPTWEGKCLLLHGIKSIKFKCYTTTLIASSTSSPGNQNGCLMFSFQMTLFDGHWDSLGELPSHRGLSLFPFPPVLPSPFFHASCASLSGSVHLSMYLTSSHLRLILENIYFFTFHVQVFHFQFFFITYWTSTPYEPPVSGTSLTSRTFMSSEMTRGSPVGSVCVTTAGVGRSLQPCGKDLGRLENDTFVKLRIRMRRGMRLMASPFICNITMLRWYNGQHVWTVRVPLENWGCSPIQKHNVSLTGWK